MITKKIKIGYVITKGNWGGAQKYVYTLATSLPKYKYDVFVICGQGGVLKNKLEEKGVRTFELSSLKRDISLIGEMKSSWTLLKIVWREKPSILHLNSPKASGFGSVAGRLCRIPKIIQTIHGWSFNENRNIFSTLLIRFFSWVTVLLCHKTIVIARPEKKQALTMPFVGNKKIILIKNGVESIKYIDRPIVRQALMSRINKKDLGKAIWIGTIAELHKNKGLEYAIKALAEVNSPFVYFILGGGEEKNNLENLIRENGLENKVFLTGFVEDANLYLKAFDIYMLTSIKEGLPYTILEAGLASLPVIASYVGGVSDIVEDGVSGILVNKGQSFEIKRAIEYLIEKPDERKKFGDKLQKKVQKEFSLEEMISKTEKLYRI